MAPTGFDVTMKFQAIDIQSGEVLHESDYHHTNIQPPIHSIDDPAELHIHIECLARLRCLYSLRTLIREENNEFSAPLKGKNFTIRTTEISYTRKE